MELSIVVLTRNSERTVEKCLDSVINAPKGDFQVKEYIIVDGGSTDRTLKIAASFPITHIVKDVKGRGRGREVGLQKASSDFVCFFDSDLVISPNWFIEQSKAVKKYPNADVWYGRVETPNDVKSAVARMSGIEYVHYQNRIRGKGSINRPGCDTSNTIFRRSMLQYVGGFNVKLLTCEDLDIGHRIWKGGGRIILWQDAKTFHYHRETLVGKIKQNFEYGYYTAYLLAVHKDLPTPWGVYIRLPYSIPKLALIWGKKYGLIGFGAAWIYLLKRLTWLYGYFYARLTGFKLVK
jgi:glycosyltransferase involved in cell wall biosynthesis